MDAGEIEDDIENGKRQRHDLKCWPAYFDAITRGDKLFDVRRDDRGYQKGDVINLREYNPKGLTETSRYTGNAEQVVITYILTGGQFGIEPGYVVLGLRKFDPE